MPPGIVCKRWGLLGGWDYTAGADVQYKPSIQKVSEVKTYPLQPRPTDSMPAHGKASYLHPPRDAFYRIRYSQHVHLHQDKNSS
jgi:hypothetical protein